MEAVESVFLMFSILIGVSGVLLAFSRKILHSLFLFFAILAGIAAVYVLAQAPFLAAAQLILYVGGILILLLIAVMLTQKFRNASPETEIKNRFPALVVVVLIAIMGSYTIQSFPFSARESKIPLHTNEIPLLGEHLLVKYLPAFEIISILLLVVLVGVLWLIRGRRGQDD